MSAAPPPRRSPVPPCAATAGGASGAAARSRASSGASLRVARRVGRACRPCQQCHFAANQRSKCRGGLGGRRAGPPRCVKTGARAAAGAGSCACPIRRVDPYPYPPHMPAAGRAARGRWARQGSFWGPGLDGRLPGPGRRRPSPTRRPKTRTSGERPGTDTALRSAHVLRASRPAQCSLLKRAGTERTMDREYSNHPVVRRVRLVQTIEIHQQF